MRLKKNMLLGCEGLQASSLLQKDNMPHGDMSFTEEWEKNPEVEKRYSVNREFIIEAHLYSPPSRQGVIERQFPELFENPADCTKD